MPLTEEERARIEENRRKAIEKRNKGGAVAAVTSKAGNSNQARSNNVPRPKAVGSNSGPGLGQILLVWQWQGFGSRKNLVASASLV